MFSSKVRSSEQRFEIRLLACFSSAYSLMHFPGCTSPDAFPRMRFPECVSPNAFFRMRRLTGLPGRAHPLASVHDIAIWLQRLKYKPNSTFCQVIFSVFFGIPPFPGKTVGWKKSYQAEKSYRSAMTSTSTRTFLGRVFTATQLLAGLEVKYLP